MSKADKLHKIQERREKSLKELEKNQKELEKETQERLEKNQKELEKSLKELEKNQKELEKNQKELEKNQKELENETQERREKNQKELEKSLKELEKSLKKLENKTQERLEKNQKELEKNQKELENETKKVEKELRSKNIKRLDRPKREIFIIQVKQSQEMLEKAQNETISKKRSKAQNKAKKIQKKALKSLEALQKTEVENLKKAEEELEKQKIREKKVNIENNSTVKYYSLESINHLKGSRESYLQQQNKVNEKINSLSSKISTYEDFYDYVVSKNNKNYGKNLTSNRTTLQEVWDALERFEEVKKETEPQLEKEKEKKYNLQLKIEEKNDEINKLEDEYIANKIKPNLISEEIKNIKHPESELTNQIYIKNAKENGYVPASEFISLVRTVEGESSLNEFLASEPTVLKTNEEELFVVLTKGTFSYSAQTDEFIFKREIEYENLEKAFESNTVYKLKSQLNEPHKLIRDVYDSGEVSERLKMYKSSNTPTDEIAIQKWESIKNSYETGFYETDAEKDERINIEKEEIERKKLEAQLIAETKQKSIEFVKNILPIYRKFYPKVKKHIFDSHFYSDIENKIIGTGWLNIKIEFKKAKNGEILKIKPCIADCVDSKGEFKFVYRTPPSSSNLRVYECEASQRSNFKGWHLTSKEPFDDDYY